MMFFSLSFAAFLFTSAPPAITLEHEEAKQLFTYRAGDKIITQVHTAKKYAKPFYYPLNSPSGTCVTRHWPITEGTPKETKDHVHQKSAWFCHGDVIPEGLTLKTRSADKHVQGVDFWSEAAGHGKIICVGHTIEKTTLVLKLEWRSADDDLILTEVRTHTPESIADGYLLKIESKLTAPQYALTFGDTKEGSFGLRISDQMNEKTGGVLTNSSKLTTEKAVWGQLANWCDYSGKIDDKACGVAIFTSPKNPLPCAWHSRGYGLMAANPFGRDKSGYPAMKGKTDLFKLAKGTSTTWHFAYFTHDGDAKSGNVAEAYELFGKGR
jgi:hypothetical protein